MRFLLIFCLVTLIPVGALACKSFFGTDQKAVDRVQSSWFAAEDLMANHKYAKALKELEATSRFLPLIHDANTRSCVAGGAGLRVAAAKAGKAYLSLHRGDKAGAEIAAHRVWVQYPIRNNCP